MQLQRDRWNLIIQSFLWSVLKYESSLPLPLYTHDSKIQNTLFCQYI